MQDACPETDATRKFRAELEKKLAKLPKEQNAWSNAGSKPEENFLWFRRNANYLVVLDKGRLAEFGTHDELMRKGGIYYGLVMAQRQMSRIKK